MSRIRTGWLLAGLALGGMALGGCAPKGAPVDTSSVGTRAIPPVQGSRWISQAPAWSDAWNKTYPDPWQSYDGMAFGPGSDFPANRPTLRNPAPGDEYLPLLDNPMFGAMAQEEAPQPFPAVEVPSESYYVNGRDMGPSPDRQQAGIPVSGQ